MKALFNWIATPTSRLAMTWCWIALSQAPRNDGEKFNHLIDNYNYWKEGTDVQP